MSENEKILAECNRSLERGRAVATSMGLFALVVNREGKPLLRRRVEKDSLFQEDFSGKWELTGGGVEIPHFAAEAVPDALSDYQSVVFACLKQKLMEEAGLELISLPHFSVLVYAWLWKSYPDKKAFNREGVVIDLAFATPIPFMSKYLNKTDKFKNKFKKRELMFVPRQELSVIQIVSERTRFLIEKTLEFFDVHRGLLIH